MLPDGSALELPDGATALDAARAIGPKLAEQAVLARVDGEPRDLRLPLPEGAELRLLTTRDRDDPDALFVLRHSSAHLLAEAVRRLHPGREGRDRPADREWLLLRLRVSAADPRGGPRGDRGRGRPRDRRRSDVGADGGRTRRGARAVRGRGRAVQSRARRHCRGADLPLHAGRLHRPLPRPAPAERQADRGAQAHGARRRVLARGREEHPADDGSTGRRSSGRRTSTRTSSGSSRRARATTGGSGRSSTCSTFRTRRRARRSGTRRAW